MCSFEQRCEHLRVEGIGGHLPNPGLRPCPRLIRTSIRTARLVAYSKADWRKWLNYGALRRIFGIRIIAANRHGGTFDDEFRTAALSRYRGDDIMISPTAPTGDAFPKPRTIAEPLFVRTALAF